MARRSESYGRLLKVLDLEDFAVAGGVRSTDLASPEVRDRLLALLTEKRGRRMSASEETWELLRDCLADREEARRRAHWL